MRYLVLSDLHANVDALEAVLDSAPTAEWDRVLVLGDLVGYGADPNGVIERVRALAPAAIIRGNHDKAACGLDDGSQFNQVARVAATWTSSALTPDNRAWLRALPAGPVQVDADVEICHGTPFDEDYYIFDASDGARAIAVTQRPIAFFGHTHLPVVFTLRGDVFDLVALDGAADTRVPLPSGLKYLVNPGSVGQPRDADPRAAYAIVDTEARTLRLRRVDYSVDRAQRRILAAGLPASLANRLAIGR
jgi:diadenosine tetraphosphatase ApaH/serine/threonine PP2A family protein phosphatase